MGGMRIARVSGAVGFLVAACGSAGSDFAGQDADIHPTFDATDVRLNLNETSTSIGTITCAEAAATKSYIGCDYWPTAMANSVWSIFDFTVVVANTQGTAADVTVTGPGGVHQTATVAPGALTKIYLPWVPELKGPDGDNCGSTPTFAKSVLARASAYHLVSTVPVTVYQFNALEFQGQGGPAGKDWSTCPGNTLCEATGTYSGCFSYTNDASLLIPTTSMTDNYRVTTEVGSTAGAEGGYFAVTATEDGTDVTITLSASGNAVSGDGIAATGPGGTLNVTLDAGDVVQVMGAASDLADLSGSLVQSNKPIEVFAGMQCADQPWGAFACDHLESSVLPAETLGTDYVVTVPTSPHARLVGHVVRLYGNVDGTTLTYSPSAPPGCPATLNAGEVVQCSGTPSCPYVDSRGKKQNGSCVTDSFEVKGTHSFSVSSFMMGGSVVDAEDPLTTSMGDPSMSPMVATEQYRTRYVFLAPTDYTESFADIVVPHDATLTLDGAPVYSSQVPINSTWSVVRVWLTDSGQDGAHVLTGSKPFGVQVIGYGAYTSYQYPAGLDLTPIAPPPPPPPK
jgi:hypothetical protein